MTKSMTEGKPLPLILQFAVPLLIGNLLQQTYNIIDAAIVGRILGADALAGVGASSSVQFLVLGFCIGVCCGFGIPIARSFGAQDYDKMRSDIFHGMALTGIFAVVLTVLCALLCPQILQILSTPDDIYENAYRYLFIIFLGIPFNLLYNLMSGIFRSVGDSRTPFMFLAFATVLNIGLDLFFIVVLHLGVAGAAAATVMAQALSGILCFIYMRKKMPVLHLGREDCRWSGDTVKLMLSMGLPMGLQYSITAIGSMVMQSANNGLGSVYVSGFTAGARIKQFAMCPFDALATGTSVFCSQNLGAGKMERIKTGIKQGTAVGILYGLFAGLVIIFFGRTLSLLFVSGENGAILDASARYLRCMGYFFWSLGILNVCRMCTQGLGFSVRVVFAGLLEMAARCVVSLFFVPVFGFTAICFADQSAWLSACIYIVPTCMHCVKLCADKLKNCDV
ncbi:MAG: MATE family efflux transporter [Lachnospiraceae bacterium]|nr:MATE family efflux transporter [Lachnospiraceae bacterium]